MAKSWTRWIDQQEHFGHADFVLCLDHLSFVNVKAILDGAAVVVDWWTYTLYMFYLVGDLTFTT